MANQKIIEQKAKTVEEIADQIKDASSVVWFEYRGLTVGETDKLRRILKESDSYFKVYKNSLVKRALDSLNIDLDEHMNGPKAVAFSKDAVAPIKALADFAKEHSALEIKAGIVDGEVASKAMLDELATIPSRDGLIAMIASGLIQHVRDIAICLDLHCKNLEENN